MLKRLAALTAIPLFAGFMIYAQQESRTETTQTTTRASNWEGTLVDAGCRTSTMDKRESNSSPDQTTTRTEHSENTDCPVTSNTNSYGFVTSDGHFYRFDQPSNERITQTIKTNKTWSSDMSSRKPIRVHVVGTPNGDVVVMESIR